MKNYRETPQPFPVSRRSGIDRRWITSTGHRPERRSGKDRRSNQQHDFLLPIDPEDENTEEITVTDAHGCDEEAAPIPLKRIFSEEEILLLPEITLTDKASDS